MISNQVSEQEFLGTVVKLLARYGELSLGQVKNKTRAFRMRRRIQDEQVFFLLDDLVKREVLLQLERNGHVVYASKMGESLRTAPGKIMDSIPVEVFERARQRTPAQMEEMHKIAWMYMELKKMTPGANEDSVRNLLEHRWLEMKREGNLPFQSKKEQAIERAREANEEDMELLRKQQENPQDAFRSPGDGDIDIDKDKAAS